MVRSFLVALVFFTVMNSYAEDKKITAEYLESLFRGKVENRRSAEDRIRASEFDRTSLKLLSNDPIDFELPNGDIVLGMMLPSGKKTPAIKVGNDLIPACVTRDYILVKGIWNHDKNIIECKLEADKLAFVDSPHVSASGEIIESNTQGKYETPQHSNDIISSSINSPKIVNEDTIINPDPDQKSSHKYIEYANEKKQPTNKQINNPNLYVLPTGISTIDTSKVVTYTPNTSKFGIMRGTWVKARLDRITTNTESGDMEITLIESIHGRYQSLPIGTVLFANKQFNSANRRLEAVTTSAITPDGEEIQGINAYVYSSNKLAGLEGSIQRNVDGEVVTAGMHTALDVAKNLLPTSDSISVTAANDLATQMLDNQNRVIPKNPEAIITVSPQDIYLKIAKSF